MGRPRSWDMPRCRVRMAIHRRWLSCWFLLVFHKTVGSYGASNISLHFLIAIVNLIVNLIMEHQLQLFQPFFTIIYGSRFTSHHGRMCFFTIPWGSITSMAHELESALMRTRQTTQRGPVMWKLWCWLMTSISERSESGEFRSTWWWLNHGCCGYLWVIHGHHA